MTQQILVVLVLAVTVGGILVRPFGRSEAWPATIGAVLMAAAGALHPDDVRRTVDQTWDVLVFLLGMMLVAWVAEQAGVFVWLAEACAGMARGSGPALYVGVVLLSALVTITLSLDTTVIMLTPLVAALARRRRVDPVPLLFACVFMANLGSLLLPVSNLSNLLLYHQLDLGFARFARLMALPAAVAIVVAAGMLALIFRGAIARPAAPVESRLPEIRGWSMAVAILIVVTLLALFGFGLAGWPLPIPAIVGGVVLVATGLLPRRTTLPAAARAISWHVFVFMLAMTLVVHAVDRVVLSRLAVPLPGDLVAAVWAAGGYAALGSNILNNLPMAVLALAFLPGADDLHGEALAMGTLIGVNVGPALTTFGSLATILWMDRVRAQGTVISSGQYLRVTLIVTPVTLILTLAAAALVIWL